MLFKSSGVSGITSADSKNSHTPGSFILWSGNLDGGGAPGVGPLRVGAESWIPGGIVCSVPLGEAFRSLTLCFLICELGVVSPVSLEVR